MVGLVIFLWQFSFDYDYMYIKSLCYNSPVRHYNHLVNVSLFLVMASNFIASTKYVGLHLIKNAHGLWK